MVHESYEVKYSMLLLIYQDLYCRNIARTGYGRDPGSSQYTSIYDPFLRPSP